MYDDFDKREPPPHPQRPAPGARREQTIRAINTAVILSKAQKEISPKEGQETTGQRFEELLKRPAYQAFIHCIQQYSLEFGISEQMAAQALVQAVKDLDEIWDHYIYQEGLDQLKQQLTGERK